MGCPFILSSGESGRDGASEAMLPAGTQEMRVSGGQLNLPALPTVLAGGQELPLGRLYIHNFQAGRSAPLNRASDRSSKLRMGD